MYQVVEIFDSIEGEGKRAGELVTFIRLAGCNLRCSYCDTVYAQEFGKNCSAYTAQKIIYNLHHRRVTLTGGEPLLHPNINNLIRIICDLGYELNIETNGSVDISNIGIGKNPSIINKPFFTMDYKCPSSGMESNMCLSNLNKLTPDDVLKFVVGNRDDLDRALSLNWVKAQKYLSPVFGKIEPDFIVRYMKDNVSVMEDYKLQLQMHKYIWNPNERGV